jgi:hypothetical protein
MKKIKFVNRFFAIAGRSVLFIAVLLIATSTHAGIINADFSIGADGLNSWLGDIVIDDGTSTGDSDRGDITDIYPTLFSTSGSGAATLQTEQVTNGDAYVVTLFQEFLLDPIAPGASLFLSVELLDNTDSFFAQFLNLITGEAKFLVSGTNNGIDISSWVGDIVSLEFTVEDTNFQLGDSLTINNIQFSEKVLEVPEPPIFSLIVAFFLILIRNIRLTR